MSDEIRVGQRTRLRHRASKADGRGTSSFYILILLAAAVGVMAMERFKEPWLDALVLVALLAAVLAGLFMVRARTISAIGEDVSDDARDDAPDTDDTRG